jgi:hypothetical protein
MRGDRGEQLIRHIRREFRRLSDFAYAFGEIGQKRDRERPQGLSRPFSSRRMWSVSPGF